MPSGGNRLTAASTNREELRPVVVITLGDPAGVGAEVALKALADPDIQRSARFIVLGDRAAVAPAERSTGIRLDSLPVEFRDCHTLPPDAVIAMGTLRAEYGLAAIRYVHHATEMCLRGEADAMVTAPLNKEAVTLSGRAFSGHTEYIAELCSATESRMLLAGEKLATVHVSTHIALEQACNLDTAAHRPHHRTRRRSHEAHARQAPAPHRRLRPQPARRRAQPLRHRGLRFIAPAVEAGRASSASTAPAPLPRHHLHPRPAAVEFDLIVAMYHDQGHIPMKLIDFEATVNISLGIPIIRTSVDHGTAFDIAGKNIADAANMKAAMRMAVTHGRGASPCNTPVDGLTRDSHAPRSTSSSSPSTSSGLVAIGLRMSRGVRRPPTSTSWPTAPSPAGRWASRCSPPSSPASPSSPIPAPPTPATGRCSSPASCSSPSSAIIGSVVVPFFRHVVTMSVYEYFGKRFGRAVRMYSSFAFAIGHFSKMGFVFYLLALSRQRHHRLAHLTASSSSLGVITIFYTFIGGLEAVIWTDVLQGFVLWTGVAVVHRLSCSSPPQGPRRRHAPPDRLEHTRCASAAPAFNLAQPTIWTMAIYGFFFYLQKYTADQTVVQRYLAARSDRCRPPRHRHGRRPLPSRLDSLHVHRQPALGLLPPHRRAPPRVHHQARPGSSPTSWSRRCPRRRRPLPRRALRRGHVHARLRPELPRPHRRRRLLQPARPRSTDRQRLRTGKIAVVRSAAVARRRSLRSDSPHTQGQALALYYTITAIVAGGLAGLFLLAFLCREATRDGAIAGLIVNLIFTAWATFTERRQNPQPPPLELHVARLHHRCHRPHHSARRRHRRQSAASAAQPIAIDLTLAGAGCRQSQTGPCRI